MNSHLRTVIATLVLCLLVVPQFAFAAKSLDPATVKQRLKRRGIGEGIVVTELDGTRVSGIITVIHDDNFEVTPEQTVRSTTIPYAEVVALHNDGRSTVAKVGKGLGIAAVTYVAAVVVVFAIIVGANAH